MYSNVYSFHQTIVFPSFVSFMVYCMLCNSHCLNTTFSYDHMFIYAEFKIINVFFKERRSKYKPAYALNTQNVLNYSCLYRDSSLVMEIWFKVMEKSWKSTGQNV